MMTTTVTQIQSDNDSAKYKFVESDYEEMNLKVTLLRRNYGVFSILTGKTFAYMLTT